MNTLPLPSVQSLCSGCQMCGFMPLQKTDRDLCLESVPDKTPVVLVLDSPMTKGDWGKGMVHAELLLGDVPFTYTATIRCEYTARITQEQQVEATQRCSVWTNLLLENRAVVLATEEGLAQMQLKEDSKIFHSPYGVVVVVPPLYTLGEESDRREHRSRVQRALKEIGLR